MMRPCGVILSSTFFVAPFAWGGQSLKTCIDLNPNDQPAQAFAACTNALEHEAPQGETLVVLLINRGIAARELDLKETSVSDLERAVDLAPDDTNALRMLAWTYRTFGEPALAEELYSRVLKFDDHWQGWLSRCAVRTDLKKWQLAISDCQIALAGNENEDAVFFLSFAQNGLMRYELALATAEQGIGNGIASPRIYIEGVFALINAQRREAAREFLQRGLIEFPDDSDLLETKQLNGL